MNELLLAAPVSEECNINLPPLEFGISHPLGQIRHLIRPGGSYKILEKGDVLVAARTRESFYRLSNGEIVVITERPKIERPSGIDGVLRLKNGRLKWITHHLLESFDAHVQNLGLVQVASQFSDNWKNKFTFRAETPRADGTIEPDYQGLRPPQLGALHAIGAHWSLYHQPATIVMPTGTGKTETILSVLAANRCGPMLVVVPSDVLRKQTADKFISFGILRQLGVLAAEAPNPIVGIVTKRPHDIKELSIFEDCNVVIGTMSALGMGGALEFGHANRIKTLVIDEAHHIGADGWSNFREAFSERRVLQFTATPFRRDGKLVDGNVIFQYPLAMAQRDGYFKKIIFEPVYEIDPNESDRAIAQAAIRKLEDDLSAEYDHLVMARCANIERATAVHKIYKEVSSHFNPVLIHSEMGDVDEKINELRAGKSRIAVCVSMLGEGFDLPQLKISAIHDTHKSLAVLLQFIGRFTRSAGDRIGNATIVANIADVEVSNALERLYSEDADWNEILSELSSEAAREHAELVQFLNASERLDSSANENIDISHQLLRPTLGTLIYEAHEFRPKKFYEALSKGVEVHRVWLHQESDTLFFVTRSEPSVRWSRSRELKDRQWNLFILHFDPALNLLFLSSSDHSSLFQELAITVGGAELISGDRIFRTLGHINRLVFHNVGVRKHGRRNLRFAMYTGADVAEALSISERAGSVKSNLSGTGWEEGRPVAIGCSYKGRVWLRENGSIPVFVKWCKHIGKKIVDDTIDTREIIKNVLIPEEQTQLPATQILGLEWPFELLSQSEERVLIIRNGIEEPLSMFDIELAGSNIALSTVDFRLVHANGEEWGLFSLVVGGDEGFQIVRRSKASLLLKTGANSTSMESYFADWPPMVRFLDLSELDGNLLIRPQDPQALTIPEDRFEAWDWSGVDINKESIWKDGEERRDSIQWRIAEDYINGGFDIVFDDDGSGEAADLVCLKEEADYIRLCLVHCKFSGGGGAGARVKDVVEVCSQAVRSAKWRWKFKDLGRHIFNRESRLRVEGRRTRFLVGTATDLNRIMKVSRFKEVRPEIVVVQPGLSIANRTSEQSAVLAAALAYLKETIGIELDVICSP